MKKVFFILAMLFVVATSFAQSANKYEALFAEAEKSFDSIYGMVLITGDVPTTNHPLLEQYVKDWESSAKTFNDPNQIDYLKIFRTIKSVQFQDLPLDTYWATAKTGDIYINVRFVEFPFLTRVMTYQAIGYVYGLPFEERGRLFMSETWMPTDKEEDFALRHSKRFIQERIYFEKLAKKYPINFYHKI